MPQPTSTLRLYLASVPGEMDGERAVIEGLVLPELRARAETMGLAIELVDPTKAKGEEWDLAQRFREIDSCRPFFLALLGERYGDPPRAVSLDLVAAYPWLAEDPGRSVLELEILHAALRDPGNAAGAFFYCRDSRFPAQVPDLQRSRFLAESERAAARLAGLKERIRASGRPVFDGYPCGWSAGLARASGLDVLAERILEDLWPAIEEHARKPAGVTVAAAAGHAEAAPAEPRSPAPPPPEPAAPRLPPETPLPVHENVQFTVYRPRAVEPMKWAPLLAFAHLSELPEDAPADEPDPLEEVKEQARRVLGDLASSYADIKQDSRYAVPHEAEITFLPEIPGFEINPPRRTFLWLESVQREEFRIRAGAILDGVLVRGRMSVFWGNILLAEINLGIRVDSRLAGATAQPQSERSASRPFRNIFPSYSHRDTSIVEEFERFARTLGDRYLRDVHELRAGEVWDDRLKDLIQKADVFQLFWSRNAMQSPYVEEEWKYALSLGRPHFVRPTYWEDPLPEDRNRDLPPDELRRLHFQLLSSGTELKGTPHGPSVPLADPSREFDPNATVIAPTAPLLEEEEPEPAMEPESPDFDIALEDTAAAAAPSAPPRPPLPPPMARPNAPAQPYAAPSVGVPRGAPPRPSSGRGSGFKAAAVIAMAVFGLSIFALRARFASHPPGINSEEKPPVATQSPGNITLGSPGPEPLGSREPEPKSQESTVPSQDFETYDASTWKELTSACELTGDEVSRMPSRAVPGASMAEIFSTPDAYNARVVQRSLESQGAFLLPRRTDQGTVCSVVLDPSQPPAAEYLRSLRSEPRTVPFPRLP